MIIWFFLLQFVNVVYHIGWFVYIEKPLHPWNKSHLIMVCELLLCCRAWFASVLLSFFFFLPLGYWPLILFLIFIYLAARPLSCSTQDLCCTVQGLSLWLVDSSCAQAPEHQAQYLQYVGLVAPACGILVPLPRIESVSPTLQDGFWTPGPPGKFCNFLFLWYLWFWYQGIGGLIEWAWACSFFCSFFEEYQRDRC